MIREKLTFKIGNSSKGKLLLNNWLSDVESKSIVQISQLSYYTDSVHYIHDRSITFDVIRLIPTNTLY